VRIFSKAIGQAKTSSKLTFWGKIDKDSFKSIKTFKTTTANKNQQSKKERALYASFNIILPDQKIKQEL
jgi:hypothetical protein